MTLGVRPADLDEDREELLAVLSRNLDTLNHERRFKWMYHENPLGPARSWLAWDRASKHVVGVASVFPRAIWLGSTPVLCGQVGDFAIDPTHRSLGPALMLQRATFEPVDEGQLKLCYDCPPHERGMATFRRLGMVPTTAFIRHARLLRTDRQFARRIPHRPLAAGLARVGNLALRLSSLRWAPRAGLEISEYDGRFSEDFSALDRSIGGRLGIRGRRTAEDLNWRYRDDSLHTYHVLTARRRGDLVGFAILHLDGADAFVVDVFGALEVSDTVALLDAASARARTAGAQTLHAPVSEGCFLIAALAAAGFRSREGGPLLVAYTRDGQRWSRDASLSGWNLTQSDIMV